MSTDGGWKKAKDLVIGDAIRYVPYTPSLATHSIDATVALTMSPFDGFVTLYVYPDDVDEVIEVRFAERQSIKLQR